MNTDIRDNEIELELLATWREYYLAAREQGMLSPALEVAFAKILDQTTEFLGLEGVHRE